MYNIIYNSKIGIKGFSIACFSSTTREILRDKLAKDDLLGVSIGLTKVKGSKTTLPKPSWLKAEAPAGDQYNHLRNTVRELKLNYYDEKSKCSSQKSRP